MSIKQECINAVNELCDIAKAKAGMIFVLGCSSSEVVGSKIGTNSNIDVAEEIFRGVYETLRARGIYLAVQCCEHLNRAIVVERAAVPGADEVNVVPKKKAGGSLATTAYLRMEDAIVVESIRADLGLDIGLTLIGMHLKPVAVPVRLSVSHIGEAVISAARVRPKFIGGERAVYDTDKM